MRYAAQEITRSGLELQMLWCWYISHECLLPSYSIFVVCLSVRPIPSNECDCAPKVDSCTRYFDPCSRTLLFPVLLVSGILQLCLSSMARNSIVGEKVYLIPAAWGSTTGDGRSNAIAQHVQQSTIREARVDILLGKNARSSR